MLAPETAKPSHGDYYVVTHDVATRLQVFRSDILAVPGRDDLVFHDFHRLLRDLMKEVLPNVDVHTIHIEELARSIRKDMGAMLSNLAIVSTCPEMAHEWPESHVLQINRLFDREGELIGYGPRPGYPSLQKQLDVLVARLSGRPFALVEEGVFTGGSVRFMLSELSMRGASPSVLALGFCTSAIRESLQESFGGEVAVLQEVGELVDWINDHDLVPFAPGCGRILGEKTSEGCVPLRIAGAGALSRPYVLPFGRPEDWASLPAEAAALISRFCLGASIGFFSRFVKADGTPITIRDLERSFPAVPVPVGPENGREIPPLETRVVDFLRDALGELDNTLFPP